MKDPVTNWTVNADLPTPPEPRTTTLYSLMVPKKQPTLLLPLRCEPASRPAGFQTAHRWAAASTFVWALIGGYGAWPPTIAVLGVNTVVPDPHSTFVLWHVEFPKTAQPFLKQASPVFVQVIATVSARCSRWQSQVNCYYNSLLPLFPFKIKVHPSNMSCNVNPSRFNCLLDNTIDTTLSKTVSFLVFLALVILI